MKEQAESQIDCLEMECKKTTLSTSIAVKPDRTGHYGDKHSYVHILARQDCHCGDKHSYVHILARQDWLVSH